MAAKKAAKKAAQRPSRPMPEYNAEEMRKRSSRTMTQKELQAALIKKYGVPEFEPMTVKEAVSAFQDVVSESNLWNYPGIMQAASAVAKRGHQASAEAYMKRESARRMQQARQKAAKKNAK